MKSLLKLSFAAALFFGLQASSVWAITVPLPVTEDFSTGHENWRQNVMTTPVNWVTTGGPAGSGDAYISSTFTTPGGASTVVFRARDTFNSSNNELFGNWIGAGVNSIDFWVRHDAPSALELGLRLPTAAGFPAMLGRFPDPIAPGVWTHLTMAINNTNPELLDETGPTHANYDAVFSNVTSIQLFANLTGLPTGTPITFDLDQFSVVPEPSTLALAGLAIPALIFGWRARRWRMAV